MTTTAGRSIALIDDAYPDADALDTAVSRAMLLAASEGRIGEAFRIHRPGRIVAFGKHDSITPGFDEAVAIARAKGFLPLVRLAGGRAAVFHEQTLAFNWTVPDPDPTRGIHDRFDMLADLMVGAFAGLGLDARTGAVPGEYCPGDFSVNLEGVIKVMGVGQRLARDAAHIGGVVVVRDAEIINDVLLPIYDALGLEMDPGATGALSHRLPEITTDEVVEAVVAELGRLGDLVPTPLDPAILEHAMTLADGHIADS
jgi:lipoate-protein ligase A